MAKALAHLRIDWALAATLSVTLVVKLTVALQLADHPLLQPSGALDTAFYVEAANRVAAGDLQLGSRAFYASPLYIYFLSLIFAVAGPSLVAARVVQALIGTVGVGLAMATARAWYGRVPAILSGALLTLTGILTFFEVTILQSALDPALMALDVWLITRAARKDTPLAWGLAGAGLGLHALNRPNMLFCVAGCALFACYRAWRSKQHRAAALPIAASVALGAMLVIAPVTIRNIAVSGETVLISSHGGLNFYIGNHAKADGAYRFVEGITPSIEGQAADARRIASESLGRPANDSEASAYFARRAWNWIGANPRAAVELAGRKLLFLLNATSPSLNYSYSYYSREESTLLYILIVGPWLLVPLGVAGFVVSLRGKAAPGVSASAVVTAAYAASLIVFFVTDRYQLPLLVPLAVAGSGALANFWAMRRRPAGLALPLVFFCALFIVTNLDLGLDVARAEERSRMTLALIQRGEAARAETLFTRAVMDHRRPEMLHYQAGHAYAQRQEFVPAMKHLQKALEIHPGFGEANLMLGQILLDTGHASEAIPHLNRAANDPEVRAEASIELVKAFAANGQREEAAELLSQLTPPPESPPGTLTALGALALELRQPDDAVRFFAAALASSPNDQSIVEQLAIARGLTGDLAGAVSALERALQQAPSSPSLHLNLAVTHAQSGRMADARREVLEALRLRPDYPQALRFLERLRNAPH